MNPRWRRTAAQAGLVFAGGLAMLLLAGCHEDETISHYQVPREGGEAKVRLLGAMVPHAERIWFFKLAGPTAAVDAQEQNFSSFVHSIRFPAQEKAEPPITWTLPAGWRQEPGSQMRFATIKIDAPGTPLELSVIPLPGTTSTDEVLANVNRWRAQDVGLRAIREPELPTCTKQEDVAGTRVVLVDMAGPGGTKPKGMGGPMMGGAGGMPNPHASSLPFKYTAPPEWEKSQAGQFSVLAFSVREGNAAANVTVSSAMGDLLANVNRWRTQQLGLGPITEEQLPKEVGSIDMPGGPANYVDITGVEQPGQGRSRILAVIAQRGGRQWFFKMIGPADLVGKQKPAFEAFVKSVRFEGGNDG